MAKQNMIQREIKRQKLVRKYEIKRNILKNKIKKTWNFSKQPALQ